MANISKLRASDVMQADVVQVHTVTPIERAIELMEEYSISGAPVVDEAGELVGVLSASDIIKRDHSHDEDAQTQRPTYYATDPFDQTEDEFFGRDDYTLDVLGRELVLDWMTPEVFSVEPDAPLTEVCGLIARERIHRVFVVEDKMIRGVISTFDVVSCLARQSTNTKTNKTKSTK